MSNRVQERKTRAPRGVLKRPDAVARNTLGSSQLPKFGTFTPVRREETRSSGAFRVPSPTSSDEEDIEAQEKHTLKSSPADLSISSRETPNSQHLLQLGDSSSLFSEHTNDSPAVSETREAARPSIDNQIFVFGSASAPKMVVEREPPKATPQKPSAPPFSNVQQPQFGQPSPLQNRFKQPQHRPKPQTSVFNIPKSHQPRPEHHRPPPPAGSHQPTFVSPGHGQYTQTTLPNSGQPYLKPVETANQTQFQPEPTFIHPFGQPVPQAPLPNSSFPARPQPPPQTYPTIIPKPSSGPTWNSYPKPQPTFSVRDSDRGPGSAYAYIVTKPQIPSIDLTKINPSYDPPGLFDDGFGAADPYTYVDAAKAAENIKALLEGAFDDEDEKPRNRGRRKNPDKEADKLADEMGKLDMKEEENKENINGKEEEEEDDEEDTDDGSVEGLKVKLLPHQVEGVEWMRDKETGAQKKNRTLPKGGILADDMGLGKTIQSLALILTNPRPALKSKTKTKASSTIDNVALSSRVGKQTLVVAPLALIKQWEGEIRDRVEDSHRLNVLVHHGPNRASYYRDLLKYDVVITTYQTLVSEHNEYVSEEDGRGCFGIHWYRVILDEAHSIKNCKAKCTKACYALRSEYRWCLTGTPVQNNLDELQSLIKFLRIKPYNEISVWREQITRPMSQGKGGVAMKRLQFYLKAFMKRRTKDVLKKEGALNPGGKATSKDGADSGFKITQRKVESLYAEFSPEERQFYNRLEQRTDQRLDAMMNNHKMSYASALVLLLRLRQACNHPKLLGVSLAKDSDALTTGQTSPTKKVGPDSNDIDDMADLLGGLSVQTKQCDVCQIELSKDIVSAGMTRCSECEEDLASQLTQKTDTKAKKSTRKARQEPQTKVKTEKKKQSTVNSDDEDEGEWILGQDQRHAEYLGKAGGSDDENAEGGGESLASPATDTDDEPSLQILGSHQRKVITISSDDEATDSTNSRSTTNSSSGSPSTTSSPLLASAKIRYLLTLLHAESTTHKFIVYSQFTSMLDLIQPFLHSAHLPHVRYDGSMRPDAREAVLHTLRTSPSCRILLCSLKCGSLGLNLTAASRVVLMEPFWNPFVEEQAIDRVHRLNQTVDVVVYKLTVKDTVESRILELQERKRALAAEALQGGVGKKGGQGGMLSMKDILALFKRDAEADGGFGVGDGGVGGLMDRVALGSAPARGVKGKEKGRVEGRVEDSVYGRRW